MNLSRNALIGIVVAVVVLGYDVGVEHLGLARDGLVMARGVRRDSRQRSEIGGWAGGPAGKVAAYAAAVGARAPIDGERRCRPANGLAGVDRA